MNEEGSGVLNFFRQLAQCVKFLSFFGFPELSYCLSLYSCSQQQSINSNSFPVTACKCSKKCIFRTLCLLHYLLQKSTFNSKCVDGNWTEDFPKCELVECTNITDFFTNNTSVDSPQGNFINSEYSISCLNNETLKIGDKFLFDEEIVNITCTWDPRNDGTR